MKVSSPVRGAFLALFLTFLLIFALLPFATSNDEKQIAKQFDHELYNELMSMRLKSVDDVITEYEYQQIEFVSVLPPGPDGYLQQETGIYAFEPSGFPEEFIQGLVPDYSDDVISYMVWIYEDPETRDRIILNSNGEKLASIPPPEDYISNWLLMDLYPLLYSGTYPPATISLMEGTYDPARLIVGLRLMTKQEIADYVWKQSYEKEKALEGGIGIMMAYTGAPVEHVQFTAIERISNAVIVTLAYPATFTNRLDIFTCGDLLTGWYALAGTTNINASTNWIEWTDIAGEWTKSL